MTESPDDKVFDDYLSRDSAVSRAYRDMGSVDVPTDIDAAVLAQARAAVAQQSKRRPAWTRWSAPVALAASIVLGVAVLLEVGVEEQVSYPMSQVQEAPAERASDASASAAIEQAKSLPTAATSEPPAAAPSNEAKQAQAKKTERALARKQQEERVDAPAAAGAAFKPEVAQAPIEAPPPPAIAEPSDAVASASEAREVDKAEAESADTQRDTRLFARTRMEPARAPAAPGAFADRQMGQVSNVAAPRLDAQTWLEQIRMLRREGKVLEADEQWRRFVEAYPDVEVPEKDLARPTPP